MNGPAEPATNSARFSPEADDVFARIAQRYDVLCDLFSVFAHRLWKARMAAVMARERAELILDLASGTGDIPVRLLRRLSRGRAPRILVTDLCPGMLAVARRKIGQRPDVEIATADAHRLVGIADATVDLVSISFAMKICDRSLVLAEALRVLRPGGVFLCLEASRIPIGWVHRAYLKYMDWCLPVIARLATRGDRSAYDYFLRGIHGFPGPEDLRREIEAHGFVDVTHQGLSGGIVALHRAVKRPASPVRAG